MVNLFKGMDKELNEIVYSEQIGLSEFFDRVEDGRIDPVLPYVCADKNGEKVFVNDEVGYVGQKAIVKQNDGDFGYHLEFVDLPADEAIVTGRKVTNVLYRNMCKDLMLIKDKDNG